MAKHFNVNSARDLVPFRQAVSAGGAAVGARPCELSLLTPAAPDQVVKSVEMWTHDHQAGGYDPDIHFHNGHGERRDIGPCFELA